MKYLDRGLFDRCGGDLDAFFSRVGENKNVEGRIIVPGLFGSKVFLILMGIFALRTGKILSGCNTFAPM